MRDWAGYGVWEERHKELIREAEDRRLARKLREACYYRRGLREWRLDATLTFEDRRELPAGGWRRALALLGVLPLPFFGAFSSDKGHDCAS